MNNLEMFVSGIIFCLMWKFVVGIIKTLIDERIEDKIKELSDAKGRNQE